MSDDNDNDNDNGGKMSISMERETIYRNIWIMKLAFAVLFAGLLSPSILQVYLTTAMRTGGFTLYFAFSILGSILIAPVLLKTKGGKLSILIGLGGYFIWVLSSFYPSWITIMPASVLSGLVFSSLYSGQLRYLALKSYAVSKFTKESLEDIISRVFGLSFSLLFMGLYSVCLIIKDKMIYKRQIPTRGNMYIGNEKDVPSIASASNQLRLCN